MLFVGLWIYHSRDGVSVYVGAAFRILSVCRCWLAGVMFICGFARCGLFRRRVSRSLFNVHSILVLVLRPFCPNVVGVHPLRLFFGGCWRHGASGHHYGRLYRVLNPLRCGRSDHPQPISVLGLTWLVLRVSLLGVPKKISQAGPYFGRVHPI